MVSSRVVPLAGVLGLIGCMSAEVFQVSPRLQPQTHPDSVQLLAQEPTRPYTVIALLNVSSSDVSQERMRRRLLKEAALLGGDAVLLGIGSLSYASFGSGDFTSTARVLSGKVIVFTREGEAAH